jgi:hypothetical protein
MPDPEPIAPSSRVARAPEQLSTEIADEVVLLGLRRSRYFGLEGVGATVWKCLVEPQRFDFLVDAVVREYDVDRSPAAADLTLFLRELEAEGLVEIGPPSE